MIETSEAVATDVINLERTALDRWGQGRFRAHSAGSHALA